jgi:hypothetical protein
LKAAIIAHFGATDEGPDFMSEMWLVFEELRMRLPVIPASPRWWLSAIVVALFVSIVASLAFAYLQRLGALKKIIEEIAAIHGALTATSLCILVLSVKSYVALLYSLPWPWSQLSMGILIVMSGTVICQVGVDNKRLFILAFSIFGALLVDGRFGSSTPAGIGSYLVRNYGIFSLLSFLVAGALTLLLAFIFSIFKKAAQQIHGA